MTRKMLSYPPTLLVGLVLACGDDVTDGASTSGTDTGTDTRAGTGTTLEPSSEESGSAGDLLLCPDQVLDALLPLEVHASTIGASDDFSGSCSTGASAPDLAFTWTAPEDGVFTFDTFGSEIDTVVFVLDGACEGEELACNDDFDPEAQLRQSAVSVELRAGQTITVVVDGFSPEHAGEITLRVDGGASTCPDGRLATAPSTVSDSTQDAIGARSASCGGSFAPERSYAFTADAPGVYTFDTFGSSFDTVLYLLDEDCDGRELACSDDIESTSASGVVLELHAGQTVTVGVDGAPGQRGPFDLTVGRLGGSCPDDDLGAHSPATISASTIGAQNTTGSTCGGWFAPDLSYAWQAPFGGLFRFDTIGSDFDTVLSVRDGECEGAELACNDDRGFGDPSSEVTLALQADQAVVVIVGGMGHDSGAAVLNITELGCPEIDMGDELPHVQMGTLSGATDKLAGSCGTPDAVDRTLGWTAPADGRYVFDTYGSNFDTVLYARDGNCTGEELACNDDAGGTIQSRIVLDLVEGQSIVLVVEGFAGSSGNWVLNIEAE